jgi:hypothetical protein
MTFLDLTPRHVEDFLDARPVLGRDDLDSVQAFAAFLRASSEAEPAPPMSEDLIRQIELGTPPAN